MSHRQLPWPGERAAWTGIESRGNNTYLPRHPGHPGFMVPKTKDTKLGGGKYREGFLVFGFFSTRGNPEGEYTFLLAGMNS